MDRFAIGFDRALQVDWLDRAASLTADGMPASEARSRLPQLLDQAAAGQDARRKIGNVLMRIWFLEAGPHLQLRNAAASKIRDVGRDERFALHWSLMPARFPFFRDMTILVARLSRLQETFTARQMRHRVIELHGDRGVVERARRHIVQSFSNWEVIVPVDRRGVYRLGPVRRVSDIDVSRILIQALLIGDGASMSLDGIGDHPALFPFTFDHDESLIVGSSDFRISTVAGGRRIREIGR
jgi:hypothetical protein